MRIVRSADGVTSPVAAGLGHDGPVSLLTEIIDAASGDTVPVAGLLRRLKVLASRSGTGQLAEWVNHELDGYPEGAPLPPYRGPFDTPVLGHFVGPFQSEIRNVPIPPTTFPKELQEGQLFKLSLPHAIAEIEQMASETEGKMLWPADAVRYYNWALDKGEVKPTVQPGMQLAQAVRPVSRQIFVGALEGVRNRVLDLALELERTAPQAGDADASPDVREEVQRIVNTYNFYGSSSNISIEGSNVTQTVNMPRQGDEEGLIRFLAAAGVAPVDLIRLQEALAADREEVGGVNPPRAGSRVIAWMGQTATAIGTGAGGNIVFEAIKAFFGG